jgi:hypothetical protein
MPYRSTKKMLMSEAFVCKVYYLIFLLRNYELDDRISEVCSFLESAIIDKLDAMDKRETFSKYKSAPSGSAEREVYRREYIKKVDIHRDWCSDSEVPFQ